MGFKLVRVDAIEPCKFPLPVGSHFIGRGKFLDCNDHRVSRKHAELLVSADSVLLQSLHQNPCFVKKKMSDEVLIFSHPESQALTNGDQFGLVPDSYWYEVIKCLEDSPTDIAESISTNTLASNGPNRLVENNNIEAETQPYNHENQIHNSSQSLLCDRSESPSLIAPENTSSPTFTDLGLESMTADDFEDMESLTADQPAKLLKNPIEETNPTVESTIESDDSRNQPEESTNQPVDSTKSLMDSTNLPVDSANPLMDSTNQPVDSTNPLVESSNQTVESTNPPAESTNQHDDLEGQSTDSADLGTKRTHTQETIPYDVKRVKTEPETPTKNTEDGMIGGNSASTSEQLIKTEPGSPHDVKPGPSNVQGGSSKDSTNGGPGAPQAPDKPANGPLRERCMYGANCYRKNPQHKATFSHPQDSDWGSDARGLCPWGGACRRRDPRHWRDHTHPPGVQPPPPGPPHYRPGMQMQLVRRHGNNFYINANSVHFYDDHFEVEDSDGDSVDFDYEF